MSCMHGRTETVEDLLAEIEVLTKANESLVDKVADLEERLEEVREKHAEIVNKTDSIDRLRSAARDYYDTTREPNVDEYVFRTVSHLMERALEANHA